MRDSTKASLVFDGEEVCLPEELGQPLETQLQGTSHERLIEVAGRTCYDSFGVGRASTPYHEHLLDVKHLSVHEHAVTTLRFSFPLGGGACAVRRWFANRPGCWVTITQPDEARVTLNLRTALEWDAWSQEVNDYDTDVSERLEVGELVRGAWWSLAPRIVDMAGGRRCISGSYTKASVEAVPAFTENEQWVSLFLSGSRGFSHEQVRHGDFTAISQRSTRYVDETDSAWVSHPLIQAWMKEEPSQLAKDHVEEALAATVKRSRNTYEMLVDLLQAWLVRRGVDAVNARKQARGAARGYLGNALYTEMVFSASVKQWKRMLAQRATQFADAEIRQVYCSEDADVLSALIGSKYGSAFDVYYQEASPDGLGFVAKTRD